MKRLTCIALAMELLVALGMAQSNHHYHVVKKIVVGGEGGWDYSSVDASARRLYVSHSTKVVILNTDNLKVIGEIPDTKGVHGVAVASEFNHGFTSNGRTSTVTIFDLNTLKVLKEVPVTGKNPDAILYDPFSKHVFTFNGRSADATVLDAVSGKSLATIPMGGKPEFAVTDGNGRIFVNIEDKSELAEIDTRNNVVRKRWSIAPGEEPSGLSFDVAHHRLFSVCDNKMMVVSDAEKGTVVTTVPIGNGPDGCKFDDGMQLVFSSNGEGTITVIHEDTPDRYTVVETVPTMRGARTMSVDLKTHALFTTTAEFGKAPAPTAGQPRRRPPMIPNTFTVLQLQK